MALRDIVLYPDSPLTVKAAPIESFGPELQPLVSDMFETMAANDGCGLAGPQVGVSKRILVLHEPEQNISMCLINPEILDPEGSEIAEEGCLSLPNVFAEVTRHARIRVKAFDEHGKHLDFGASGLLARIIQHETDHLDGIVFPDRLDILSRAARLQEWEQAREQMSAAVSARCR